MNNPARSILRSLVAALLLGLAACTSQPAGEPPLAGARIGGPFTLTDQNGRQVSDTAFAGKYRMVYFGYTFCPDVCPTALQHLMQGLKAFTADAPAEAAKIQPIFITVDPARDTPAVMKQYVAAFDPRLIGLTGSEAEIAAVAKRVFESEHDRFRASGDPASDRFHGGVRQQHRSRLHAERARFLRNRTAGIGFFRNHGTHHYSVLL